MKTVNISEARTHLPAIVEEVLNSQERFVITRHGRPAAAVVPFECTEPSADRHPLRGRPVRVADDFDEPMPNLWNVLTTAEPAGAYTTVAQGRSAVRQPTRVRPSRSKTKKASRKKG